MTSIPPTHNASLSNLFGPAPFVLLEDRLSPQGGGLIYTHPVDIIRADTADGVEAAFQDLDAARCSGLHAAGFFAYELGYAIEPKLRQHLVRKLAAPLLWFGIFETPQRVSAVELDGLFASLGPPQPLTALEFGRTDAAHRAAIDEVQTLIAAGDLYQANLTLPLSFRYDGDPLALYAALRVGQPTAYSGCLAFDETTVLSVSPELFFEIDAGRIRSRPMKGTAARGQCPEGDARERDALRKDPKQRAENLMITDLTRNDLSRIARLGTVKTPALFTVETFPTFHALVSTVEAEMEAEVSVRRLVEALFPCGSIVGAPKIRAAEIIAEREIAPRGVYTGAIGAFDPEGGVRFNVAIRTAMLCSGVGVYGVGGGIVSDSVPEAEVAEAKLKAKVLTKLAEPYELIETFRWEAREGWMGLEGHLKRLHASACALGFQLDLQSLLCDLDQQRRTWGEAGERRVRIALARDGRIEITAPPAPHRPELVRLCCAREILDAGDPFLRHKTSRRALHEAAFAEARAAGADEAILLNRRGCIADCSRHTLFVVAPNGLVTPPIQDGALPGVLRATIMASGQAFEQSLRLEDLSGRDLFVGNSLNGLRRAALEPVTIQYCIESGDKLR